VPRLEQIGLYTIGDVRRADSAWLKARLGSAGAHFQSLARAEDPRRVARRRSARSMGSDRTLVADVRTLEEIQQHLRRSADRIGRRLRQKNYQCAGVRVKLKTNRFQLHTRQARLSEPVSCSDRLYAEAVKLLDQFDTTQAFRLVGMAAYDLRHADDPQQLGLLGDYDKNHKLEKTVDNVIEKFGANVIGRAGDLNRKRTVADVTPNLDFIDDTPE